MLEMERKVVIMGFLDSISSTVNRGVAGAGRATNTMKLKSQISEITRKRSALAAQLGASLYDVTKDDANFRTGREQLYDGIAALDKERDDCQAEIARIEAEADAAAQAARVYICPQCGGKVAEGDLFCSGCGMPADQVKAAAAAAAPQSEESVFCPKCGAPITAGDTFCMNCGAKIEAPGTEAPGAEVKSDDVPSV